MTRHFLTLEDLNADELIALLDRAAELKRLRGTAEHPQPLAGKSIALIFDKASTRTRISFEVGVHELGALPVTLIAKDTQLGRGEPIEDTAEMLSRFVHGVVYRTFGHERLESLAKHASIPVINGLSDDYHPCQLLADLMTIREHVRSDLKGVKVAWIGDGNNMAHSWLLAAGLLGLDLRLACPNGYKPNTLIMAHASTLGNGKITLTSSPERAVQGADVVTTDVWASMGQESEAQARIKAFEGFCVDAPLMANASPAAMFLHCLPAHRGEEVAAAVIDGSQARVWDEAENRLHAQKALLEYLVTQSQ